MSFQYLQQVSKSTYNKKLRPSDLQYLQPSIQTQNLLTRSNKSSTNSLSKNLYNSGCNTGQRKSDDGKIIHRNFNSHSQNKYQSYVQPSNYQNQQSNHQHKNFGLNKLPPKPTYISHHISANNNQINQKYQNQIYDTIKLRQDKKITQSKQKISINVNINDKVQQQLIRLKQQRRKRKQAQTNKLSQTKSSHGQLKKSFIKQNATFKDNSNYRQSNNKSGGFKTKSMKSLNYYSQDPSIKSTTHITKREHSPYQTLKQKINNQKQPYFGQHYSKNQQYNVSNARKKYQPTYQNQFKTHQEMRISTHNSYPKIWDFAICKNLGEGRFGTVHQIVHKLTGAIFALKKIPKQKIKSLFMLDQFILEIKLQSFTHHQHILSLYGYFDDADFIYLILEYMEQGTLYSQLKRKKTLPEKEVAESIKQIGSAVKYLHQNQIAHRDIKPQNIVMTSGVCKLCDFGWATICKNRRTTYCGTFDYTPPQILQGQDYDDTVDLWCLGVLTYELLVGKAPFYHIRREETKKRILNVQKTVINYPSYLSQNAISFIDNLIKKDPNERLSSQDLLKHPFLMNLQDQF